jgi:hypothetical protein
MNSRRNDLTSAQPRLRFSDKNSHPIKVVGSSTLTKAGLKNGDMLNVGNQGVELTSVKEAM